MDGNLFWANLTFLIGDLLLSQPIHRLANHLALESATNPSQKRKIYRYSFGLTNPIAGSDHSFVTGHHFVEILFLFLTLLGRYPRHREGWLAAQAKETARKWILFANGKEPWDEYIVSQPLQTASAKIAICDDLRGWHVKTIAEDEQQSQTDPWGRRRYDGWEAIEEAYLSLQINGAEGTDEEAWARDLDAFRLGLLGSLSGRQLKAGTDTANKNHEGRGIGGQKRGHREGRRGGCERALRHVAVTASGTLWVSGHRGVASYSVGSFLPLLGYTPP